MTALSPWVLAAAAAALVPIFLHLFHRHQTRRLSFPALRYLERTEREHARRIRLRQLLLLLVRVGVVVLLAGAGARLVFLGPGASHPPTAAVIVIDNSMSSGLVTGDERVLDELKQVARLGVDAASSEDELWVVSAGEPWRPAIPGNAAEARAAIGRFEVSDAGGDLTAALAHAAELLRTQPLPRREIHLLSDLQRTAFDREVSAPAGDVPVIVWAREDADTANRAVTHVVVGGGLPPLQGQRAEVTIRTLDAGDDTSRVPARILIGNRVRGAATLLGGSEATVALPPNGSGWVRGVVDTDPDELRADDRRYFAYRSRPAPRLTLAGEGGLFVAEALSVLQGAGRAEPSPAGAAELLVASGGAGLDQRGSRTAALVLPPADATLLPALNRRLAQVGVPWRYEARPAAGGAELAGPLLPDPLRGVRAERWYDLVPTGTPSTPTRTLAEVAGRAWAIEGTDPAGRPYLLVASPMDAKATTLPVSTGMVRFLDWAASQWAGAGGGPVEYLAGLPLDAPASATHVRPPSGEPIEIDGTRMVQATGAAGFYEFLAADTVIDVRAVNPPPGESSLAPLTRDALEEAVGRRVTVVRNADDWASSIFRVRQGPELWWPLLAAAIVLVALESLLAASRRGERERTTRQGGATPSATKPGAPAAPAVPTPAATPTPTTAS